MILSLCSPLLVEGGSGATYARNNVCATTILGLKIVLRASRTCFYPFATQHKFDRGRNYGIPIVDGGAVQVKQFQTPEEMPCLGR